MFLALSGDLLPAPEPRFPRVPRKRPEGDKSLT